jgi:hypothetical protein
MADEIEMSAANDGLLKQGRLLTLVIVAAAALGALQPAMAQPGTPRSSSNPSDQARALAEDFYAWYLSLPSGTADQPRWVVAVRDRPQLFHPILLSTLQRSAANARCFTTDPFLGNNKGADVEYGVMHVDAVNGLYIVVLAAKQNGAPKAPFAFRMDVTAKDGRLVIGDVDQADGRSTIASFSNPKLAGILGAGC